MNNKQILVNLLIQLANVTGNAITKQEAISKGLGNYLSLDNYPMYGGYNLVRVNVLSGGHDSSFNSFPSCGGRVTASVMIEKIRSFINGVKYSKTI